MGTNCSRWINTRPSKFPNDKTRALISAITFVVSTTSAGVALADNAAPPAMMLPGQFNVSASGTATYTVPISVPPGTAGMMPSLSFNYSSQSGDGIVGLGWSLSGLPVITRCPRTVAQDSIHGGVNYDNNDKFCLGGQRLIVTSGTYGADGAHYRTEIETFTDIISKGTAGNGPAWFEVHARTGQVLQLGNTTDSRILAVGKTSARVWAVNKITDTKGNYLTVTYTNDTTNGQFYPTRIDYTGNSGLATYNSVRFTYNTARPDQVPTYQAGSIVKTTVLLTDIKTYNSNTVVNDYKLAYELGTSLRRSRLTSVTLCDNSTNCIAPTTFGYQGSRDTLTVTATANGLAQGMGLGAGDFNYDGLLDVFQVTTTCPTGGVVSFGSQAGTFAAGNMNAEYDYYKLHKTTTTHYNAIACMQQANTTIGDINGDGFSDIATRIDVWTSEWDPETQTWIWIANPAVDLLRNDTAGKLTQVNPVGGPAWPFYFTTGNIAADFNGDGRTDGFVYATDTTGYLYFSNGDGTYTQDGGHTGLGPSTAITPADFDGDGCSDILGQGGTDAIFYFCQPATAQIAVTDWTGNTKTVADFNGDGKSDILVVTSTAATLYLSTGAGLATGIVIPSSSTWHNYAIVSGDWNGDGQEDVALISHTSGSAHLIFLSTGTGFTQITTISNSDATSYGVVADWNNDGADDIWIKKNGGDTLYTFAYTPERLATINNGLGASTTITYDRLNKNGTFYAKGTGTTYPVRDVDGPTYAVSRVDTSDGIGGTYGWTYTYQGAKIDQQGRGSLGFTQQAVTDLETGIITTTTFRQDYPYIGRVATQTVKSGTITLSSVTNTYANTALGGTRYFIYLQQSVLARKDLDNSTFPTVTTAYTYDTYGNPLTVNTTLPDGSATNVTNTFTSDTVNWILGQLTTTNMQKIVGSSNITRHFSFGRQSGSGLLNQVVVEPSFPTLKLQADLGLDNFGNRNSVTLSGQGISTRTTSAGYETKGRFATTRTNALSQADGLSYNQNFGTLASRTDPNNVTTSWSYDWLGRQTLETRGDGNKTTVAYYYCAGVNGGTASCPTYGAYGAKTTPQTAAGAQNGAIAWTYYDALNRVIAQDVQGFDGTWIRVATQYDGQGRVWKVSRPYFIGQTQKWTTYTYDALARPTQAVFPDNSDTTYAYHGLTTSATNDKNQTTTTVRNNQGFVATMTDAMSRSTGYTYDAFGDLTSVTDTAGNAIVNTYDARGRKLTSSDPDMGSWQYGYDVLNEVISQTDAASQVTGIAYDVLGRVTSRTEPDLTSTYVYDLASQGIGKLYSATASNGYARVHSYDSFGRPTQTRITVPGANGGNPYIITDGYDANGRLGTIAYPSGFTAGYAYNGYGYLSNLKDNASAQVFWMANTLDAELHILSQSAGNGVTTAQAFDANTGRLSTVQAGAGNLIANLSFSFDTIGNLTQRRDFNTALTENICYDSLNRLTNYAVNGADCQSGSLIKTVGYDWLGNITTKSDAGTYSYPAAGQPRPHAVSAVAGAINANYSYDANGNTLGDGSRTFTWTASNMVSSVTQGVTSVSYAYDCEHNRISQTTSTGMTVYLRDPASGIVIEQFVGASSSQWNEYLYAAGRVVAARFAFSDSSTIMRYFIADHLGSTAVLTDELGALAERDSYDAWGKRRNPDGSDNSGLVSQTTRGFSGQEHTPSVGLINYNARFYDPAVGRFISADSVVPGTYNGQSFNRYSYALNDPSSLIDPSGHATENDSCPNGHCTKYDAGGGPPCFGCSGPGTWNVNGYPVSVAGLAYTSVFIGNVQLTYNQLGALMAMLHSAYYANAALSAPLGEPVWMKGYSCVEGSCTPWSEWTTSTSAISDYFNSVLNYTLSGPPSLGGLIYVQYDANPPGTDWDLQEAGEHAGELGPNPAKADLMAAGILQANVQEAFLKLLAENVPYNMSEGWFANGSYLGYEFNNPAWTFYDRNGDKLMDVAYRWENSFYEVNYGYPDFDSGWRFYDPSNTLSPPPVSGN